LDHLTTANGATQTSEEELIVRSELGDSALIPSWIKCMACVHAIPVHTKFVINLRLEEIPPNLIRHGDANE
jgi:hypothetical protein